MFLKVNFSVYTVSTFAGWVANHLLNYWSLRMFPFWTLLKSLSTWCWTGNEKSWQRWEQNSKCFSPKTLGRSVASQEGLSIKPSSKRNTSNFFNNLSKPVCFWHKGYLIQQELSGIIRYHLISFSFLIFSILVCSWAWTE